jgi:hypothetical protein
MIGTVWTAAFDHGSALRQLGVTRRQFDTTLDFRLFSILI